MSITYFRVEDVRCKRAGPKWRAAATIIRADTDEPLQWLVATAPTQAEAEAQLGVALAGALAALAPPTDWGRDPTVPRLVQRWLRLRDEVYGMVDRAEPGARAYHERQQAALQAEVAALTEAQREELVLVTADQIAQLADPHVLDTVTAKRDLARLIAQPSPEVVAGRDRLRAALEGA